MDLSSVVTNMERGTGTMKLLIIGGTIFLGRALVDAALERGHEVTLFNRGRSSPGAIPALKRSLAIAIPISIVCADGAGMRSWIPVAICRGRSPCLRRRCANLLITIASSRRSRYTRSPARRIAMNRHRSWLWKTTRLKPSPRNLTVRSKYAARQVVQDAFPHAAFIIRSGLIVGPRDPTNRFTYWVTRAARGGDAIAPPAGQPVQFIDARDLAAFILLGTEARLAGVYNVTGPAERMSFGQLLPITREALGSGVRFHHVSDDFLRRQGVAEFMGLPLWLNRDAAESFMTFNIEKARAAGLSFRPLAQTINDTCEWARTLTDDVSKPADLAPERERALLEAWNSLGARSSVWLGG